MLNCVGAVLGILEVDVRWYVSRHQCQEMLHDHQGGDFGGGGGGGCLVMEEEYLF